MIGSGGREHRRRWSPVRRSGQPATPAATPTGRTARRSPARPRQRRRAGRRAGRHARAAARPTAPAPRSSPARAPPGAGERPRPGRHPRHRARPVGSSSATSTPPWPAAAARGPRRPAAATASVEGDYRDVPLTQIRKTIARRLAESIGPVPTFYLTAEFDLERVAEMRAAMAQMGDEFKVSFNDIILKAAATALAQHPEVQRPLDGRPHPLLHPRPPRHGRRRRGRSDHAGDLRRGPQVAARDRRRIAGPRQAGARPEAHAAGVHRAPPSPYRTSACSASTSSRRSSIRPRRASWRWARIEEKPVVVDGSLAARKRLRVTMSCDHRVIDGATGASSCRRCGGCWRIR